MVAMRLPAFGGAKRREGGVASLPLSSLAKAMRAPEIRQSPQIAAIEGRSQRHELTVAKLHAAKTAMQAAQDGETRAEAALEVARDNANATEWEFHNAMLRAKEQVIGQLARIP